MLCCQKKQLLGLAGACLAAAAIVEKESRHSSSKRQPHGLWPLGVELQNLLLAVFQLRMPGVLDYREPGVG